MDELYQDIESICKLKGDFTLRSGKKTDTYFDKYLFEAEPGILRRVAKRLSQLIDPSVEVLAGLEMGGIPIVTALALETGLPAAYVRKQAKPHGTAKIAEGATVQSKKTLIVEDIISTGGQVILSAKDLRESGADLVGALCVITRSQDVYKKLAAENISLTALFDTSSL